jgi:hypothetical protein
MAPANFSMPKNKSVGLIVITATLLSLMFAATLNSNFTYAQNEKFKAKLKGENEVPPVTSTAGGKAKFKVKDNVITSKINITGITDVTAAHIHAGIKGQNGEPVVDLLKTGNQSNTEGRLIIQGEITPSDLQGSMAGKTLEDLQTAMGNEETYVNVHTSEHPDGEIRGQIKVSGGNATETGLKGNATAGVEE